MSGIPEELIAFVQVLTEDEDLRAWFESFEGAPEAARCGEFRELAARMRAADEAPALVEATALLAAPEIYRAARAALRVALEGRDV